MAPSIGVCWYVHSFLVLGGWAFLLYVVFMMGPFCCVFCFCLGKVGVVTSVECCRFYFFLLWWFGTLLCLLALILVVSLYNYNISYVIITRLFLFLSFSVKVARWLNVGCRDSCEFVV